MCITNLVHFWPPLDRSWKDKVVDLAVELLVTGNPSVTHTPQYHSIITDSYNNIIKSLFQDKDYSSVRFGFSRLSNGNSQLLMLDQSQGRHSANMAQELNTLLTQGILINPLVYMQYVQ